MENSKKNSLVKVEIFDVSTKGNGLGWLRQQDGSSLLVEIPFTFPGDVVEARLIRKKGLGAYRGKLERILIESPSRVQPKCNHYSVCGGCRFQHVDYQEQLQHKQTYVRKCFENLGLPNDVFMPILSSTHQWEYRNKMDFSFSSDLAGNKYLGLVMDATKGRVFNIAECHLSQNWFMAVTQAVKSWWDQTPYQAYRTSSNTGSLRMLTLREGQRTGDRMVILTASGNPDFAIQKKDLERFVECVRAAVKPMSVSSHLSIYLRLQEVGEGMSTNFYEMRLFGQEYIREQMFVKVSSQSAPLPLTFHISPSTFFHHNVYQCEQLCSVVLALANIPQNALAYHLYCGISTLGLSLAKHGGRIVGVELSPETVLDARRNAVLNGCINVSIVSGAVRHMLEDISLYKLPLPDVLLVTPPRPGVDPIALENMCKLPASKIVYVSSNPSTLAKNVSDFIKYGYRVECIQPVDQYPQTAHVENIVILTK